MGKALVPLILLAGAAIAHPLLAQDAELMDGALDFGELAGLLPALFALILYFVPTIIAHVRDVRAYAKIFFVNMLLGWTVVGWIAVLIWSVRAKPFFGRRKRRARSVRASQKLNDRHTSSTLANEAPKPAPGGVERAVS